MKYSRDFPVQCDLSQEPLMEAGLYVGPSFSYEIRVNPIQAPYARHLVRRLHAAIEPHPFAPCLNVVEDASYGPREWSVHANGISIGSLGVV